MMKLHILLLFLGFYSIEASPAGYKVEEYAMDEDIEEDEDWSAGAKKSALKQDQKEEQRYLNLRQKAEVDEDEIEDGQKLSQNAISELAELVEEDSQIGEMHSKLSNLEQMGHLQKRWKELADELHAARVEEFLDGLPKMPTSILGLEAEVDRLENVKKIEGLVKQEEEREEKPVSKKVKSNLLQVKSDAFEQASRERRVELAKAELASLKSKVEAQDAQVAASMHALDKAEKQVASAHEALADAAELWKESEKELRGRDREWAQKERAHLEKEYATLEALKESTEKKLAQEKFQEEEFSGQQMLTSVSLAMQEAHNTGATLESFTETLKKELDKNELDVTDFIHYAKKEKNPHHLAGWGLFKNGPASIAAAPIATALKQLDANADADALAAKLFESSA